MDNNKYNLYECYYNPSKYSQTHIENDIHPSWDSENWLKRYCEYNVNRRELRKEVWDNTASIVKCRKYILSNGEVRFLGDTSDNQSCFYTKAIKPVFSPLEMPPQITVISTDCLDVAHDWVKAGMEVSILNMASIRDPGKGCREGTEGQEEYLFRCSNYCQSFYQFKSLFEACGYGLHSTQYYLPLGLEFGGIYSPNVVFFRKNEENGYALVEEPWKANVIAVAGVMSPETVSVNNAHRLSLRASEIVKNKIRTIFRIACDQGQRNLILGAIGCGAYRNPPQHIAELFHEVLFEQEYIGAFQRVCFAIKSDSYSNGDSTYHFFYQKLNGSSRRYYGTA